MYSTSLKIGLKTIYNILETVVDKPCIISSSVEKST